MAQHMKGVVRKQLEEDLPEKYLDDLLNYTERKYDEAIRIYSELSGKYFHKELSEDEKRRISETDEITTETSTQIYKKEIFKNYDKTNSNKRVWMKHKLYKYQPRNEGQELLRDIRSKIGATIEDLYKNTSLVIKLD
ncbi:uncharacterized protein LOC136034636 [Artemia franciscana]|uniref:uncharacterized protein LOC136034636 n=1 Tax=Artemia franciscana TaxID=6661 RepID=UPI0032DBB558